MESEEELIASCLEGESAAWDTLFDRYYALTTRFVFQLSPVFSREDVEEVAQEVFIAVVRNLPSFQGASSFQTWLFRIAINKGRDFLAKSKALKRGNGEAPLSLDALRTAPNRPLDPPAKAPSPDAVLMNRERLLLVREALDDLGDPCREIIELRYFGDLSYEQIASELNMNAKTVSSRLSKCLAKFQELARPLLERENSMPISV